jgi:hypothetical protein
MREGVFEYDRSVISPASDAYCHNHSALSNALGMTDFSCFEKMETGTTLVNPVAPGSPPLQRLMPPCSVGTSSAAKP